MFTLGLGPRSILLGSCLQLPFPKPLTAPQPLKAAQAQLSTYCRVTFLQPWSYNNSSVGANPAASGDTRSPELPFNLPGFYTDCSYILLHSLTLLLNYCSDSSLQHYSILLLCVPPFFVVL